MNKVDTAESLMRKGFHELAKPLLLELVTEEPDNLRVICDLGIVYTETGENEKAIRALRHYLMKDVGNAYAWEALACANLRVGNLETAHENLKRSLEIMSKNHSAPGNPGILPGLKGLYYDSIRTLGESLNIYPDDYRILYALNFTLRDTVHTRESIKILKCLQRFNGDDIPDKIRLHTALTLIRLSIGWEK